MGTHEPKKFLGPMSTCLEEGVILRVWFTYARILKWRVAGCLKFSQTGEQIIELRTQCREQIPLHTICRCLQTMTKLLLRKKIKICETWRKEVYTLFVIDPSFAKACSRGKYGEKSSLNSSKNRLLRRTRFAKKFFVKCSQIWRISLYTLFAFAQILSVRSFFVIVHE